MIILRWARFPDADIVGFKLYRSIIGFTINGDKITNDIIGSTLSLKLNGGAVQHITFTSTNVVQEINAILTGGRAMASNMSSLVFVRSDIREAPGSVEILPCSAASILELTPRIITELSENVFIVGMTAPVDPAEEVVFEDLDGSMLDYYAVSSIDSMNTESDKTTWSRAINSAAPLCVIEGLIVDIQGRRLPDIIVEAKLETPPACIGPSKATVLKSSVSTLTGQNGRFSLPILQGAVIRLTINAIGYDRMVTVPEKSYVLLEDLSTDEKDRF